jgi:hypothetical protein
VLEKLVKGFKLNAAKALIGSIRCGGDRMAGLSKSAVTIKAKSRDRRKRGIPALIYTQFGTIYTILGIANGLTGRQAGRRPFLARLLGPPMLAVDRKLRTTSMRF